MGEHSGKSTAHRRASRGKETKLMHLVSQTLDTFKCAAVRGVDTGPGSLPDLDAACEAARYYREEVQDCLTLFSQRLKAATRGRLTDAPAFLASDRVAVALGGLMLDPSGESWDEFAGPTIRGIDACSLDLNRANPVALPLLDLDAYALLYAMSEVEGYEPEEDWRRFRAALTGARDSATVPAHLAARLLFEREYQGDLDEGSEWWRPAWWARGRQFPALQAQIGALGGSGAVAAWASSPFFGWRILYSWALRA